MVGTWVGPETPVGWGMLPAGVANSVRDVGDGMTTAVGARSEQATKTGKTKRAINNNAFTMPGILPRDCYPTNLQQRRLALFVCGGTTLSFDRQRYLRPVISRSVHQRGDLVGLHFRRLIRDQDIG